MSFIANAWNDERIRHVVIQIMVILAVFSAIAWLVGNVVGNFAALNKNFGFDFLSLPAGYDINQSLIDYNNRDSHFRASLVGLLNTLLVAAIGIVFATILGVILGILRLSQNWLARNVTYWYVEFSRNVPVLLQILLWHGILINTMPAPRQAHNFFSDSMFVANRGLYIPEPQALSGFSWVYLAIIVGLVGAFMWRRYAIITQERTGKILPRLLPSAILVLGLPVVVFIFMGSPLHFSFPVLRGFNFQGGIHVLPELVALTFALSVYTAAFIAEIVRAGILSVHKGQREAAEALGLKPNFVMNMVILPQARRVIIPPLTSQYLNLTKNSSLAIAIGYMDLVATLGGITLNQTGREIEAMILVMAVYLSISLSISLLMNWYNHRARLVER
ncbi:MAG: ABC transporter permease subunit [Alphaproteobacteria bacterium]|nr:ABC transporter permease subunit [Alphaproteobacteria bacterium]